MKQALSDKFRKNPEIRKSNPNLKPRNIKERKYPQSRPTPPAAPLEAARNNSREKYNLKSIRKQYKFSKSEENIDQMTSGSKTEPNTPKRVPQMEAVEPETTDLDAPLDLRALSLESLLVGGISRYCRHGWIFYRKLKGRVGGMLKSNDFLGQFWEG